MSSLVPTENMTLTAQWNDDPCASTVDIPSCSWGSCSSNCTNKSGTKSQTCQHKYYSSSNHSHLCNTGSSYTNSTTSCTGTNTTYKKWELTSSSYMTSSSSAISQYCNSSMPNASTKNIGDTWRGNCNNGYKNCYKTNAHTTCGNYLKTSCPYGTCSSATYFKIGTYTVVDECA